MSTQRLSDTYRRGMVAIFSIVIAALATPAFAGTSSGSSISFGLQDALNEVLNFLQGPIVFTVISIAIILGVMGIIVKASRGQSVSTLGVPVVGGLALLNIESILDPLGITVGSIM